MKKALLSTVMLVMTMVGANAIDFDARITNLDGSATMDDKGKPVELNIGTVCINALMAPTQEDANLSGEEKIRRFSLAQHIQARDKDYAYTSEDVSLLKKLVNKMYPSPLIVTQTWRELERK